MVLSSFARWGFSRDQMIPLVAAMGVWGMKTDFRRLWDALPEDLLANTHSMATTETFLGKTVKTVPQSRNGDAMRRTRAH
jgi:hypothetical protein